MCLVVAAACGGLGVWQWRRLLARRASNAEAAARRAMSVVQLPGIVEGNDRPVRVSGGYDHGRTIVLRGRVERGVPGVHLVTPLLPEGADTAVLVLRGFAPAMDAVQHDTAAVRRPQRVEVEGVAFMIPVDQEGEMPVASGGSETWRRLAVQAVRARLPYPVHDFYVHAVSEQGELEATRPYPAPVTLRPLDDGPHLFYMLQWFGIGLVALGFGAAQWLKGSPGTADRRTR